GAATVNGGAGGREHPVAGGAQEVGVVVDTDDIALVPQPVCSGDAGDGFDHRAVHAAVHDAVRLVLCWGDRPVGPHDVGADLDEFGPLRMVDPDVVGGVDLCDIVQMGRAGGGLVVHTGSLVRA